jgi:hypothetical protein
MTLCLRKRWEHALRRREEPWLLLVLILLCFVLIGYSAAAAQDVFRVTKEARITADIADLPLGQALEVLSQKIPLDIRGSVAGDARLTLHFSQLTLQEALQKMMAGYNYVLIRPDAEGKLVLVVLGKAQRGTGPPPSLPMAPSAQSAALPPSPSAAPPPLAVPAPPSYDETIPSSSSAAAMPSPPVPAPPTAPVPAVPASEVQAAATGQGNLPPGSNVQGTAGATPNPDSQPEFNPAAWGGRGFRGSPAPARK